MKKLLLLPFLCLLSVCASADDPAGIKFFNGSWNDVLAEARRQNKPIFVDVYTTWCGPCKQMAKEAFPDPKVAGKFNASFINYKIDAEKGEGIDIARRYAVTGYPTSLYVSASGDLIHREMGYGGIQHLLAGAAKALEAAKDPKPLSVWEQELKAGKRDAEFLYGYLQKRAAVGMPDGEALEAYLNVIPESEWFSEKNLPVVGNNLSTSRSRAFDALMTKIPALPMSQAKTQAMMRIQMALYDDFKEAVKTKDETALNDFIRRQMQAMELFRPTTAARKEEMIDQYRMQFYQQTKNMDKFRPLAAARARKMMEIPTDTLRAKDLSAYKRFEQQAAMMPDSVKKSDDYRKHVERMKKTETGMTASGLNNLAWTYSQNTTDPADLNAALAWSQRSLELDRQTAYLDTYAQLLNKLGRKKEAIPFAEEAVRQAKAKGEDAAQYEKNLEQIKK